MTGFSPGAAVARRQAPRPRGAANAARRAPARPARLVPAGTFVLSTLTATILLALALSAGPPLLPVGPSAAAAPSTLVRAYYAAVNAILAEGDGPDLAPLVAPDVVAHLSDRSLSGRPALVASWTTLGHFSPGLRLALTTLLVDGDQASATVEPIAPTSSWPDLVAVGPAAPQPAADRFQLAQGRIVEYWSSLDPRMLPEALPPLPLPLPLRSGPILASLARFTLPPHAALDDLIGPGPHLLLPRLGALTVTADGSAQVMQAGAPSDGWRTTPTRTTLTLRADDAILIAAGVRHALRNATDGPVVLLGVLLTPGSVLVDESASPLLDLYRASVERRSVGMSGAAVAWLAQGLDRCSSSPAALRVVTRPLDPGQAFAPHRIPGVELLAIEQGAVLIDRAPISLDATLPPADAVAAGDAIAGPTGISGRIVNAASEPARLLAVVIGSPDGACGRMAPDPDANASPSPVVGSKPSARPTLLRFPRTQT